MFKSYEEMIATPLISSQVFRKDGIGHSEIRLENIKGVDCMVIIVSLDEGHTLCNEVVNVPESTNSYVNMNEMVHHIPFKDFKDLKGWVNLLAFLGLDPHINL